MGRKRPHRQRKASRESTKPPPVRGDGVPVEKPRDLWWAIGLSLLAGLHRTAFLLSNRDREWPFTVFYEGDSETFFHFARAILGGQIYDAGIPFHPPTFPYFLAAIHRLLGAGPGAAEIPHLAVKLTLAWVSSLAVGLVYLLVRPYLGRTVALVAAGLCVYHFGLYVISVAPVSEGIFLVLLLITLLVWTRTLEHPLAAPNERRRREPISGLGLGLLLGILALTRAEAVLMALLLWGTGVVGWWRQRSGIQSGRTRWRALVPWMLVAVGWAIAVTPWTMRNARRLAEINDRLGARMVEPLPTFVPLTLYGPMNLALANHPEADGTFSRNLLSSRAQSGKLELTDPQHLEALLHGHVMAWDYIHGHPLDYARLVGKKWAIFFASWRLGWTQWDWPGGLRGIRRPVDLFSPTSTIGMWLMAPCTLLGLTVSFLMSGSSRRWAVLVLLLGTASLVTTALFFGYVRQGVLLVPFFLTLMATALVATGHWFADRKDLAKRLLLGPSRRLLAILGSVALVLLLVEAWGATANRNYRATGTTLPGTEILNRDLAVELEPLPD